MRLVLNHAPWQIVNVELTLTLPENVAKIFGKTPDLAARHILESAAVEGYRSGRLSHHQVREMLELSWRQTEEFLAAHNCLLRYSISDLEEDRRNFADLPAR
jgi:hypothetical protein